VEKAAARRGLVLVLVVFFFFAPLSFLLHTAPAVWFFWLAANNRCDGTLTWARAHGDGGGL
jgi:hypothetical protein